MQTTNVPVKAAVESKINWMQFAGIGASLAAYFGLSVSPDTLVAIILGVQAGQSLLTAVLRTWFTTAVTVESVK